MTLGFLPAVIAASIFARIIKFALPQNSDITKYSSVFISICLTAILIIPSAKIINAISEFNVDIDLKTESESDYSEIFGEEIANQLYPSVETYVYDTLESSFLIKRESAEVHISFDTTGDVIAIAKLTILLKNSAVFADTASISRFFEEKLLCPVDVSVDLP